MQYHFKNSYLHASPSPVRVCFLYALRKPHAQCLVGDHDWPFFRGKTIGLNGMVNAILIITTGLKPTLKQTVKYVKLKRSV